MPPPRPPSILPRSLFGRALLILLVPIVLLQLLVGLVFFQRHYERVSEQMSRAVALELRFAISEIERAPDRETAQAALAAMAAPLRLGARLEPERPFAPEVKRSPIDLTGRTIVATLLEEVGRPLAVDLVSSPRIVTIAAPTAQGRLEVEAPRNRLSVSNPHQLLVVMLIASVVLSAVAVLFLRNQVRPIRELAEAADAFGKGRSLPLRPSGAEEVRRAAGAFLSMRARIERQIEQRTQMLSGVSHDLRTPLTRIKLTLALLEDEAEATGLREDVDQMERMIGAFLAFARGEGTEESVPVDPVALAERLAEDARRGGTEVTLTRTGEAAEDAEVTMRPIAVRRAVENLVGNAARHGRRVTLEVRLGQRSVEFVVEDDGPGIAPEDRARALTPFARLDAARNQDRGAGVGLGLAIAMDVARGHGGTLELGESPSLGGLRAVLRIPR